MKILLVSHLFKREISGGKFKALLLWILPYAYLLAFASAISFAAIKVVDVDSLGAKAISLLLVLACGLSLVASYVSLARISMAPASKVAGIETSGSLRVSWKIYEILCFGPILILAMLSLASFLRY